MLLTFLILLRGLLAYRVGTAIADITGISAEIIFMGYATTSQGGSGIQLRQRARAFVFEEDGKRVVYVSNDVCMLFDGMKDAVIANLKKRYGDDVYTHKNVLLHATHTHNGPGGYAFYPLYNVFSLGFNKPTFDAIVTGITTAITRAHDNLQDGVVRFNTGTIDNANANRSPTSYLLNPDHVNYEHNTDHTTVTVRVDAKDGSPLGVINQFAVHGTSQNLTNTLISGDNKGLASYMFERTVNGAEVQTGNGSFVAAFGQGNCGDISPNLDGGKCPDGSPCEPKSSTCNGKSETCIAGGPGKDMQESCEIIANRTFSGAFQYWNEAAKSEDVLEKLDIQFIHTYVDMEHANVSAEFTSTGKDERTCTGALGDSFAAGTTDGHGDFDFTQGVNSTSTNKYWNFVAHFLSNPTKEQIACQHPKPILINTGGVTFPCPWTASKIPKQIIKIGNLYFVALPGEFTTMAGRRIRDQILKTLKANGVQNPIVLLMGLSNTYTHYITTYEEFQAQRYEAASTLYGPHTLARHTQDFVHLAAAMAQGKEDSYPPGTPNPNYSGKTFDFKPGVVEDTVASGKKFGDVQTQPVVGDNTVSAVFWGASPRNDVLLENSFCDVQKKNPDGSWKTILRDSDWVTKFSWKRHSVAQSLCTCSLENLDEMKSGTYRFVHRGVHKNLFQTKTAYSGTSNEFSLP